MNEIYAKFREEKPNFQTLKTHLNEVAELSKIFGKDFGFPKLCEIASLLHDAGKSTFLWQEYLKKSITGGKSRKRDHSTVGAQLIRKNWLLENQWISSAIESVIMYHHGSGLPDMISPNGESEFCKRLNKDSCEHELSEVEDKINTLFGNKIQELLSSQELIIEGKKALLEKCKIKKIGKKQVIFNMGLQLRNLSSCLIDADRICSAAFEENETILLENYDKIPNWSDLLSKLENHLQKIESLDDLGKIKTEVSNKCSILGKGEKGVYSCSAFTGAGKTFASLRFALEQAHKHNMKHIFIIAPYTSIIDQNADEIRRVLEDENSKGKIVLECHSNISVEKKTELLGDENLYSKYEQLWDAPIIITTMVQFLETLFGSGTQKIRRMHHLSNSVFVFDEIQTLPIKTTYLFNWGIEYLVKVCGCSAMLCTATQPGLDKIDSNTARRFNLVIDEEVIQNVKSHFESLKRVDFLDMTDQGRKSNIAIEICDYVKNQMITLNSFLIVVNTKPQAKELFELLKMSKCSDYVFHLSTNMCPAHRKAVISEIKEKLEAGKNVVCISTQLIEAGVDLSFQGAIRFMAGLDSIIQTAGRCNRYNELKDSDGKSVCGCVAIFSYRDEKIGSLEELKIAQKCMEKILYDFRNNKNSKSIDLINPEVIDAYFKLFYKAFETKLDYSIKNKEPSVLNMLSDNESSVAEYERIHSNDKWKNPYVQSFRTAWEEFEVISDSSTGIMVPYGVGKELIGKCSALEKRAENYYSELKTLLKEAQQVSINVYSNQIEKLKEKGIIYELFADSGIYVLNEEYYSKNLGLVSEIQNYFDADISVLSF